MLLIVSSACGRVKSLRCKVEELGSHPRGQLAPAADFKEPHNTAKQASLKSRSWDNAVLVGLYEAALFVLPLFSLFTTCWDAFWHQWSFFFTRIAIAYTSPCPQQSLFRFGLKSVVRFLFMLLCRFVASTPHSLSGYLNICHSPQDDKAKKRAKQILRIKLLPLSAKFYSFGIWIIPPVCFSLYLLNSSCSFRNVSIMRCGSA